MKKFFVTKELESLKELLGNKFTCVAGTNLTSNLLTDQALIMTEGPSLQITGALFDADFAGFVEEYGELQLAIATTEQVKKANNQAEKYLHRFSSRILDVLIVSETLSEVSGNTNAWDYTTDVSVILVLETGFLCVTLLSHGNELFVIEYKKEFALADLEPTTNAFTDDLFSQYVVKREVLTLEDALARVDA